MNPNSIINYKINSIQHTNTYKSDLEQFYEECKDLQKEYSMEFTTKNMASMKISYTPNNKTSLAARLDYILQNQIATLQKINPKKSSPQPIVDASLIIQQAKLIIKDLKNSVIQELQGWDGDNKWRESGFEKWLDAEIETITFSKKTGTVEDAYSIVTKFWQDCLGNWLKKNNLEKYIPNQELAKRMDNLCKTIGAGIPECSTFALCYLKIDELFYKKMGESKPINFLREAGYLLVSKPLPNDIIIYFDSNDQPIHIGVFINSTRVISKIGRLCIFKHDLVDEKDGKSYIILRKPT